MENQVYESGVLRQWYAVVANNGFMYTDSVALISKALESWICPNVTPMPNADTAARYAINEYVSRFYARNWTRGIVPKLPINLPPHAPFLDPDFNNHDNDDDKHIFPRLPF